MLWQVLGRDDFEKLGLSVRHRQDVNLLLCGLVEHRLHQHEDLVEERRSVQDQNLLQ